MSKVLRNTIPFKQVRTSQPQTPVEIDWSNPITRGLVNAANINGGSPAYNLVLGKPAPTGGTLTPSAFAMGYGKKFASAAIQFPRSVYTGAETMLSVCRPTTVDANPRAIMHRRNTTTIGVAKAGATMWLLAYDNAVGLQLIAWQSSGATCVAINSGSANVASNETLVAVGVVPGNGLTAALYKNGNLVNSATQSAALVNTVVTTEVGGMHANNTSRYFAGDQSLALHWNRALSDAEIRSLSANPWQIFQPITHTIPYDMVRGAMSKREAYLLECSRPPAAPEINQAAPVYVDRHMCNKQPQYNAQIDWSNSITNGLYAVNLPSIGMEVVSRTRPIITNGRIAAGKNGISLLQTTSEVPVYGLYIPKKVLNARTEFVLAFYPSHITWGAFLGNVSMADSIGNYANVDRLTWRIHGPSWNTYADVFDGYTASSMFNKDLTLVLKWSNTNNNGLARAFVNSREVTNRLTIGCTGVCDRTQATAQTSFMIKQSANSIIYLQLSFSRYLSDAEINSLSANPWQIFKPLVKTLPFDIFRTAVKRREEYTKQVTPVALSQDVPSVVIKQVRTSQPQTPVGIDWSNPITKSLKGSIDWAGSILYDAARNKYLSKNMDYTTPLKSVATPCGFGDADTVNANNRLYGYANGDGYQSFVKSATVYIKNGAIIYSTKMAIDGSDYNEFGPSTRCPLYWSNTSGQRRLGCWLSWDAIDLYVDNVSNGLHTVAIFAARNLPAKLYLDGTLVATSGPLTSLYYNPKINTAGYQTATINTLGIGNVLAKRVWAGWDIKENIAREISANPWQIFQPETKVIPFNVIEANRREKYIANLPPPVSQNMPVAMVKEVCTSQPQYNAQIDWSNPITLGLVASFNGATLSDSVTEKPCVNNGATKSGGATITDGTYTYMQENFSANAYVNEVTILAIASPAAIPTTRAAIGAFETTNKTRGSKAICITSDGEWGIAQMTSNGLGVDKFGSATVGRRDVVIATRDATPGSGGVYKWCLNGVKGAAASATSGSLLYGNGAPTNRFLIGKGDVGVAAATTYFNGATELCVFWDRVLSDAEIESLSANPWQIFKSPSKPVWVPA